MGECAGGFPSEFVGLRPKMYSLDVEEGEAHMKAKGAQKSFVKNKITHQDYVRCITSELREDQQQHAKFTVIRNKMHGKKLSDEAPMLTQEISKVGLCAYDNKRWLKADGITSLAYGHYLLREMAADAEEPEPEVESD